MKTIVKIIASLCAGLFAVSCQQFYVDTQMTPEKAAASLKLECDALDAYTIQGEKPQSVSFSIASTTPWNITGWEKAEWLKVSPASSALSSLSEDIVITASANPDYSDRSVTLTIQDDDKKLPARSVVITQSRKGKLFVQPVSDVFEVAGNALPFTIETNLAWEARSADQWLSFSEASGTGDGSVKTIQAIAVQNNSITRSTTVTVSAGDEKATFEVTQKGQSLEFLPTEETAIDRKGGELLLGVKATMNWKVECDNADITVEKVGDDQVKVSAPYNGKFAEKTATITIKPVSDDFGDVSSSISVSQGINFKLEGNCEVLSDGSVKISGGAKSRVTTLDEYRYVNAVITLGEVKFSNKGEFWFCGALGQVNIYNQLTLGGNQRTRLDGYMADGNSSYKSTSYGTALSQAELESMKTYGVSLRPEDGKLRFEFLYNGEVRGTQLGPDPFAVDTGSTAYWFGGWNSFDAGTSYVVKSCEITAIAE